MRRSDNSLIHFIYWIILTAMLMVLVGRDLSHPPAPPGRTIQDTHTNRESQREHSKDEAGKPFWQQATEDPAAATAVFTLVLTVFTAILAVATIGLYRVTRIAADAARDSADALPNLERAYIFIEIYPQVADGIMHTLGELINTTADGGGKQTRPIDVRYQFINHGKTPAVIKTMSAGLEHWVNLPSKIEYADKPLPREIVVRAGEIYPEPAERHVTNRMNERFGRSPGATYRDPYQEALERSLNFAFANSIRSGNSFLWFFGHVVYDDVFGREHETRFC